ncbi:MAG: beta-propeller domain-containing protein, partial [Nitrosopumilaceae archaeon]|nr:beta-propeller domain-containing protein [Nitrosopumilaceae archaeon]
MSTKIILPIAVAVAVIATAGIMFAIGFDQQTQVVIEPSPQIIYVNKTVSDFFEGTQEIKKVSSESELREILSASNSFDQYHGDDWIMPTRGNMLMEESFDLAQRAPQAEPAPGFATTKSESDGASYSTTNVQVDNVDEPDYLKNDAKYVYIVSQNTLTIIDAYPAESAKIVLKIALDIESQWIQ